MWTIFNLFDWFPNRGGLEELEVHLYLMLMFSNSLYS